MSTSPYVVATLFAALAFLPAAPAAAQGEVLITQAKVNAGNITPGDAAGFPATITRGGVYRFASNLNVPANKNGIEISAADVTIDFAGFSMRGGTTAFNGIVGTLPNASIKGGTIRNFKEDGISGTGHSWIISDMRLVGNKRVGIKCGQSCLVHDSIVTVNSIGIAMDDGIAIGNVLSRNTGPGLQGNTGAGAAQNAFILNSGGAENGHLAGNAIKADPNLCRFTASIGPC
jgi:hypothetical protein